MELVRTAALDCGWTPEVAGGMSLGEIIGWENAAIKAKQDRGSSLAEALAGVFKGGL
jgi:hypothetical protein